MNVHNLMGQSGNFETSSAGQPTGVRTFCFWSRQQPQAGDFVVKPHSGDHTTKTLWQIEGTPRCTFTGSDGNQWWEGVMKDVVRHNLLTQQMVDLLTEAGLG